MLYRLKSLALQPSLKLIEESMVLTRNCVIVPVLSLAEGNLLTSRHFSPTSIRQLFVPHWVFHGCGWLCIPFDGYCLQFYNTMNVIKLESQGVDPFTRCVTGSIYSWNTFGRNFIRFNILSLVLQEGGIAFTTYPPLAIRALRK